MKSQEAMSAYGDMANMFHKPQGQFDAKGVYTGGKQIQPDAKTMNTKAAVNSAFYFGSGGLPAGVGQMAGILPAAVKIGEYRQMQQISEKYYEKYIKDFNRKYGFTEAQINELRKEFKDVTEEIKKLIPDGEMRNMYDKYIESYPFMYLSMIPAEALQTKLAVKCFTENQTLRKKTEDMSKCVSTLVRNLTEMQISAGIPPIINLMFDSMPDPLTAMTDPMYHKYNDAIVTYHNILRHEDKVGASVAAVKPGPNSGFEEQDTHADYLRNQPLDYLERLLGQIGAGNSFDILDSASAAVKEADGTTDLKVPFEKIYELLEVMQNMNTQSGCQPFGNEWNHTGPEPAMNPAMCLSETDKFQPGNPRNNVGRTNLYQAKRDQNGNARWVQSGVVPGMSSGGGQMVQPAPSNQYSTNMPSQQGMPQQGMPQQGMPQQGMPSRQMPPQGMPPSRQMPQQGMPVGQFNQAYAGAAGPGKTPRSSRKSSAKPKKKSSQRRSA